MKRLRPTGVMGLYSAAVAAAMIFKPQGPSGLLDLIPVPDGGSLTPSAQMHRRLRKSKYMPHQGAKECARRRRQIARARIGYLAGEKCNRNGCSAIIEEKYTDESCSCQAMNNPPCGFCTTPREYCPKCEWDAEEESYG